MAAWPHGRMAAWPHGRMVEWPLMGNGDGDLIVVDGVTTIHGGRENRSHGP